MFAVKTIKGNPVRRSVPRLIAGIVAGLFAAAGLLEPVSASARLSRQTPPSTPGNFHVTGVTDSSVTLAWTASKAGSNPNFNYVIVNATTGGGFSLGKGTTSVTDTLFVQGGHTYSFYIYAIDSNGNKSANSPTVTATLPAPPPPGPPAAPVLSLVGVTPSTITVAWPQSGDDVYSLFVDGVQATEQDLEFDDYTEWTVINLAPGTTHTINVQAFNPAGASPLSNPVTATTSTATDTTPPAAPTGLNGASDGGGEAIISFNPSTDNVTPQSQIEYRFYVNGALEAYASVIGQTSDVFVFPNGAGEPQAVYVVAVDQAGNVSPPSNTILINF